MCIKSAVMDTCTSSIQYNLDILIAIYSMPKRFYFGFIELCKPIKKILLFLHSHEHLCVERKR